MEQLLRSYRVLDLADEKGAFCGKILGDFGADVIKIEPPGGSPARHIGPFYHDVPDPEKSLSWFAYNSSKRGITLNVETADGQEIFRRLAKTADFIIESFAPGYMESLGIDYNTMSQINPGIIVCSITSFGQTGPYREYKSCDLVALATGGLLYICGDADRPPVRANADVVYCLAGVQSAMAMIFAHHYRRHTKAGQHIDISLQECVTNILWHTQQYWDLEKEVVTRLGTYMKRKPHNGRVIWECKDGAVSWQIHTAYTGDWTRHLVEWMVEEGMASDELREVPWEEIDYDELSQEQIDRWGGEFAHFFLTKTKAELVRESLKRQFMIFPCNNMKDCVADEQLTARGFWVEVDHPELGVKILYPAAPLLSNETQWSISRRAPLIGEHNQDIYANELGFSKEQLVHLKEIGVI